MRRMAAWPSAAQSQDGLMRTIASSVRDFRRARNDPRLDIGTQACVEAGDSCPLKRLRRLRRLLLSARCLYITRSRSSHEKAMKTEMGGPDTLSIHRSFIVRL